MVFRQEAVVSGKSETVRVRCDNSIPKAVHGRNNLGHALGRNGNVTLGELLAHVARRFIGERYDGNLIRLCIHGLRQEFHSLGKLEGLPGTRTSEEQDGPRELLEGV